ncbi:SDR family oxidoreductase [Limnobacter humi]|uniref:SDR family oxidoreductase n=1 Tax=Limnobacter humi TaxID=1778671 RepID=A0ABT1WJ65_9BURK|nr:SDR family oxidoreductase [Limnobacter humi]MCQ8896782.1 SDR family oxidoreductase [Limnobacter humi]
MRSVDQVAMVTGGGTGIGQAISLKLANEGYAVAVIYSRSSAQAQQTVAQIQQLGQEAMAIAADVSDRSQVVAAVARVIDRWGKLNVLVYNAAITRQLPFEDLDLITDDVWDVLLSVNLKGTFHCCHVAAPYLRQQADTAIVNVGSIAGETGFGSSLPYAVSKAAVHGLTRSLARALAPHIRVNCIAPGVVDTRWWNGHEDKMQKISGELPLQRMSTPDDIAASVYGLLVSKSITGQVLRADNGQTL